MSHPEESIDAVAVLLMLVLPMAFLYWLFANR